MTLLLNRSPRLFSVEEYYRLAELGVLKADERVELIGGEIVPMSPHDPKHSNAVAWCTNLFSEHFGRSHLVRVQLPLRIGTHSEPEPDLGLLEKSLASGLVGHPTGLDFVLEVANTSLAYDRCEKLQLYARAQIPEYWIVNLRDQWVEVYRDPQGNGYGDHFQRGPGEFLELLRLPGPRLAVSTLLGQPDA
jgi:Uma2 family endonuclease